MYFKRPIFVELVPPVPPDLVSKAIRLTVDSSQEEIELTELFDRSTFRRSQMVRNMRIALSEAGRPGLESVELVRAVNNQNKGMEMANQRYFIHSTLYNADGTLSIRFSNTSNGTYSEIITVDPIELDPDANVGESAISIIRDNLASWFRLEGITTAAQITPAVLARLNAQRFYA